MSNYLQPADWPARFGVWGREHWRMLRRIQDDCGQVHCHLSEEQCMILLQAVAMLSQQSGNSWMHCWGVMLPAVLASVEAR